MGKMIEFIGYNGKPIFIASDKIMSVNEADEKKHGAPMSTLTMAVVGASEEWLVRETIDSVRIKYDNQVGTP